MLPSELVTIISSYLTEYQDLESFEYLFRSQIDWITLIVLNYPKFYHININEYRVKYVYYDFIISRNYYMYEYVPTFCETLKYLFTNDLYDVTHLSMSDVIKYDDCDIFEKLVSIHYEIEEVIYKCLKYKSKYILIYILDNNKDNMSVYNSLTRLLSDNDNYSIMIKTIKLVISKINFTFLNSYLRLKLLTCHQNNRVIFDYMFDLCFSEMNDTVESIRDIIFNLVTDNYNDVNNIKINDFNLKKFYNKYPDVFNIEYINKLIPVFSHRDPEVLSFLMDVRNTLI